MMFTTIILTDVVQNKANFYAEPCIITLQKDSDHFTQGWFEYSGT